jgi:hypothetical protein
LSDRSEVFAAAEELKLVDPVPVAAAPLLRGFRVSAVAGLIVLPPRTIPVVLAMGGIGGGGGGLLNALTIGANKLEKQAEMRSGGQPNT